MLPYSYTSLVRVPEEAALISCASEYLDYANCKETSYDVSHFVTYLKDNLNGVSISDIDPHHIQAFIDYRANVIGEKPSTVKRRYYKIKGFFDYLEHRYRSYRSPIFRIELPRQELPEDSSLSDSDVEKIKAYLSTIKDYQERLCLSLKFDIGFDIGARPMDYRNLTVSHFDLVNRKIVKLKRKGGFYQTFTISEETARKTKLWLPIRQRILKDSGIFRFESLPQEIQDQYPLFPSVYNARLKDRFQPELFKVCDKTIFDRMVNAALAAGVKLTPMQCRHTFGHELWAATKDLMIVQKAMGHTTPTVTVRYISPDDDLVKQATEQSAWRKAA